MPSWVVKKFMMHSLRVCLYAPMNFKYPSPSTHIDIISDFYAPDALITFTMSSYTIYKNLDIELLSGWGLNFYIEINKLMP